MKSVQDIKSAIISADLSADDINSISQALTFARSQLTKRVKRSLQIGDNVNFTNSRTGRNYTGHVVKIAIKYVTVRTTEGLWKVPASMLTLVEDNRQYA